MSTPLYLIINLDMGVHPAAISGSLPWGAYPRIEVRSLYCKGNTINLGRLSQNDNSSTKIYQYLITKQKCSLHGGEDIARGPKPRT